MVIKDVSVRIFEALKKPLLMHGFIFNKGKKEFKRTTNGAQQIFDLFFHKENDGSIFIEPQIRIKISEIENIYHKVSIEGGKSRDEIFTLGNNFIAIMNYIDKGDDNGEKDINTKYMVENDSDVDVLIKVIPKRFEEYALPYFDSNSTIAEVDKLLNENPRNLSVHNLIYPIRACIGIIAAKLSNNPHFENLVSVYEEELQDANPVNKEEFDQLKRVLMEI